MTLTGRASARLAEEAGPDGGRAGGDGVPGDPGPGSPTALMRAAVAGIVIGSGVAGAAAGSHPTGTAFVDPVLSGGLAALVAVAGAAASRGVLLVVAVVGVGLSRRWMWIPSATGLLVSFLHTLAHRRRPLVGALSAAAVAQAMLRWPAFGLTGLPSLVAVMVTLLILVSAGRTLSRPMRRWLLLLSCGLAVLAGVFTAGAVVSLLGARAQVERGIGAAKAALSEMGEDRMAAAIADLSSASDDLNRASGRVSSWWAVGGEAVPIVAQQRRAVMEAARAGAQLAESGAVAARAVQSHRLDAGRGTVDLSSVRALERPVQNVASTLNRTIEVISALRSPWLIPPLAHQLAGFGSELRSEAVTVGTAASFAREAPVLLGGSGPERYLVAFTSPAEDRGLGGFIGAYAVVTADQGHLTLSREGRAPLLEPPAGSTPVLHGPAHYLDRYSLFHPEAHFQDLTYSPDFPTVEEVISQIYPQMQGGQGIDGVLLLDPYALQALLRFTGPITVSGLSQPLTTANAADILLRRQYLGDTSAAANTARHDVLQELLTTGFRRFVSGALPSPSSLATVLEPLVKQGRLLFWTPMPAVQPLLRRVGLDGAFPRPGPASDVLAVTLSNYDNNKIDGYLHESVKDEIRYDPGTGLVDATVTVDLRNGASVAGLPGYVIGSFSGSGIPLGTDEEWLTLYTPFRVASATFDGVPFHFSGPLPEVGVLAYSGYVEVPAGATGQLRVSLVGRLPAGSSYRMVERLQPLANPVSSVVVLHPSTGWTAPRPWTLGPDSVQSRKWILNRAASGP